MAAAHRKDTKSDNKKFKKATLGIALIATLTVGGVGTLAGFTDDAKSTVTVQAGTIDLTINALKEITLDFGSTMKPGDSVTRNVTVKNTGTLPLNYSIKSTGTPGKLAEKLTASVKPGSAAASITTLKTVNTPNKVLQPGASETVAIIVSWTAGATDDSYQGTDGTTVLNFSATQII